MKIKYYENDLPENLDFGDIIAIDTETMGLNPAEINYVWFNYLQVMGFVI